VETIVEIQPIKGEKKRVFVVFDNGSAVQVFSSTVKEYGLKAGQTISPAEVKRIAAEGERHVAFTTAVDSLSRSLKSQNEIRAKLKEKKFSSAVVDETVDRLKSYNYLGDEQYVETFINYKGEKYGRRKIIYELSAVKGIDKRVVERIAYERLTDETELEKAIALGQKYSDKEQRRVNPRIREKVYSFLAVRGFDNEIISRALEKITYTSEDDNA
jgi:Uncharacterized protein conserved in bacteria